MKVTISPKDTTSKVEINVKYVWQEGNVFCFVLCDLTIRKYPMQHIWYIQFNEKDNSKIKIGR